MKCSVKRVLVNIIEYMFWAMIILDLKTVYRNASETDYHIPELVLLFTLLLTVYSLTVNKITTKEMRRMVQFFLPIMLLLIMYIIGSSYHDYMSNFIVRFFIFLPMLIIVFTGIIRRNRMYSFTQKYVILITIMSAISLVFWLFGSQLHIINPNGYIKAFWGVDYSYPSYFGIYFERQRAQLPFFNGLRNIGIFSEAPIFSLALVGALMFERFFISEKVSLSKSRRFFLGAKDYILVLTIITTFSTTGYIITMLIYLIDYLRKHPEIKKKRRYRYVVGCFAGIIVLVVAFTLVKQRQDNVSYLLRMNDYYHGFKAWLSNPIFGTGYGDANSIIGTGGISNSLVVILSQGGIILLIIYVVPFIITMIKNNNVYRYISIIILMEIVVTVFQYTFFMMTILSLAYATVISGNNRVSLKRKMISPNGFVDCYRPK